MNQLLLPYLFVCFSVGLVCMGVAVVVVQRTRSSTARAFLAFYAALTLLVLASLLLAFLDVLPEPATPQTRAVLEYLEAIVAFYGVLLTATLFAHRLLAVSRRRDVVLATIVGLTCIGQHFTEYGLGGRWDDRGDLLENLVFVAVIGYVLVLGLTRQHAPGVERPLARRFVALFTLCLPIFLHDLFLIELTGLRLYPLAYTVCSAFMAWTLYRHASASTTGAPPAEWGLSAREAEVAALVVRGLSNKEIAAELFISANTVKTHLRAVFDKSGCRSRFALMSALASGGQPVSPRAEDAAS